MHIKAGDTVQVITGADRGQRAKVLRVNRKSGRALVEGLNRVFKHVKPSQKNPQGGRLSREMPINMSNLQLVCDACKSPTRTGVRVNEKGVKERFCKKKGCGAGLGAVGKAKAKPAAGEKPAKKAPAKA